MKVFEPFKINEMELKNRMVVSAMVTNYCSEDGMATEKFIAYHEHKAKGGWGLIITEDYAVTPTAGGFKKLPGLWEDGQIESHKELTRRIHEAGGKIAAQIYHAGRETSSAITGEQPIGLSALKDPTMPETPREMTVEEIHELVEQFGDCARRAKEAGFDAVEVHGAHGYLIGAFASPFSNKRSDEYVPGGLEIEESKVLARLVEEAGADCIHCSQGVYASTHVIIPPSVVPRAAYVENAAEIKKVVDIPVIAVGRINDVEIAESVLQADKADFVTMARASLADPDMPKKVLEGREDEVIRCIGCLQGCSGENGKGNCVRCLVNPLTGMEDEYDITPVDEAKKVVVVGGGVSGCEAAVSAAVKGHKVTLIEQSDRLGGQWIPAAVPIGKGEFTTLIVWQKHMLDKLGVEVIPSVYLAHYLDEFEEMIKSYDVSKRIVEKGTYLTQYGVINNTAHFIKKGIIHLSLGHDKGKKSLNMFGAGTVFPIGVEVHEFRVEYEMIIQALTDVECYEIPYPTLKKMAMEHGDFAGELLRENCDFIGYMFFDSINQTFEPCLARICDILYLYLTKVPPMSEKIPLSQTELASIAGASHSQMERAIQILKKEEILQTSRKQIEIINREKLLEHCTLGMRTSI